MHLRVDEDEVLDVDRTHDVVGARVEDEDAREAALEDVVDRLLVERRGDVDMSVKCTSHNK